MYKILIADDEYAEINLLEKIVRTSFNDSVEIQSVSNGRMAKSVALLWNADIILMDIEMPGLSGLEASKEILKEKEDVRIIFITAYSLFNYARDALQLGASDYILKPVNPGDVTSSLRKVMNQIEAMRQLKASKEEIDKSTADTRGSLLISKVKQYLQSNYMNYALSLEAVADLVKVNTSYLSMLFKKETGINFTDYITDLRTAAAKELLKDPLRNAGEIAEKVGFESASYFTRAFKKKTGMTPTDYRKSTGGLQL